MLNNSGQISSSVSKTISCPDSSQLIGIALAEDIGSGDITSEPLIEPGRLARARVLAKEQLVLCGQDIVAQVFHAVDSRIDYQTLVKDGQAVEPGVSVGEVAGPLLGILSAERTSLNFLQRLSGIATLTARFVELVSGTKTQILDTRKTTPAWRELEKYAVAMGGGVNHRRGLFDAVLLKDNHLDAVSGDISSAVRLCREKNAEGVKIEVEVRNRDELERALAAGPDAILLDNMSAAEVKSSLQVVREGSQSIFVEASGGISLENVVDYAETGVDAISLGALTHSARAVDLSLQYVAD